MDKRTYRVVSFYTKATPYEQEVKLLVASLKELGIDHKIYPMPNKGDWVTNCGLKPSVIYTALQETKRDVVFLDADAVVNQEPVFFDTCNLPSFHITEKGELLSGTLFFPNNLQSRRLIRLWITEQLTNPKKWDQVNLHSVVKRHKIAYTSLPLEYVKIFDRPGDGIITHNQASRRFKTMLNLHYPATVGNCRTRLHEDGTFSVARINAVDSRILDSQYGRIKGENRWLTKVPQDADISNIAQHFGTHAYIVGKGPTLDLLNADDFPTNDPIVCINESVHKIAELGLPNKLFTIQQDSALGDTCVNPASTLLASRHINQEVGDYRFTPELFGLQRNALSVIVAIEMLKSFDIEFISLLAFDATVNKKVSYADCIGYSSDRAGDPKRFLTHRVLMDKALQGIEHDYVTRDVPDSTASSDTPLTLPDNLEEHHEHQESESEDDPPHTPESTY